MTSAPTPTAVETPWFDSHENLYKLAEWLRQHHGWQYFKDNAIDMLETPWSWSKEWRLASGDVAFVEVERPRDLLDDPLDPILTGDTARCTWCEGAIGIVAYDGEFGPDADWIVTYRDDKTGDYACSDCATSAANFHETADQRHSLIDLPELTPEMRVHFKAFDHTELFPVLIVHTVQTELGNILIEEGTATWGARNTDPAMSHGSISVWTKQTHYAGVATSSIKASSYVRLAGAAVPL
jgi:hypothetical protein